MSGTMRRRGDRPSYTPEKIVRLFTVDGITQRNIAARFQLSVDRVGQILDAAGVDRRKHNFEHAGSPIGVL